MADCRRLRCRPGAAVGSAVGGLAMLAPLPASAQMVQALSDTLVATCWACDTLDQITGTGVALGRQLFDLLAGEMRALVGLVMALWLLLFAGRAFLPFGPAAAAAALWNKGAKQLLRFALVLAALQGSDAFWDDLFVPVLSAGATLAARLIAMAGGACAAPSAGLDAATAVLQAMTCPLAGAQTQFSKGMVIGLAIVLGGGWHSLAEVLKVWQWPGQLVQILSGLALVAVYGFGFLVFPLLFLDTLLRAIIIAVVAPLALAGSLFRPTATITRKALWNLAQAAFTMIFAAIAVGIGTALLAVSYGRIATDDGTSLADWPKLIEALESGNAKVGLFDQSYWMLLGVGVVLIFMLRQAGRMAAAFTGASAGDFSGAGSAIASMAGSAAWGVGAVAERAAGAVPVASLVTAVARRGGSDKPSGSAGGARPPLAAAVAGPGATAAGRQARALAKARPARRRRVALDGAPTRFGRAVADFVADEQSAETSPFGRTSDHPSRLRDRIEQVSRLLGDRPAGRRPLRPRSMARRVAQAFLRGGADGSQ